MPRRADPRPLRAVGCLAVALVLVVVAVIGWRVITHRDLPTPIPPPERCVATAAGRSVAVELDQAHYASLIAAVAVQRRLPARAVSIALATAYQESGIRNLDYGDRDSVGLFQQRPSQGWGTARQLQDPRYSARAFYRALVRIDGWQTADINDVAQRVQRSGFPEAYRDHEPDGRTLASVLTGHSPAGLGCLERAGRSGRPGAFAALARRYLDVRFTRRSDATGSTATLRAPSRTLAWAYGHFAVAHAATYGVSAVQVGGRSWTSRTDRLSPWEPVDPATPASTSTVVVTFRR